MYDSDMFDPAERTKNYRITEADRPATPKPAKLPNSAEMVKLKAIRKRKPEHRAPHIEMELRREHNITIPVDTIRWLLENNKL